MASKSKKLKNLKQKQQQIKRSKKDLKRKQKRETNSVEEESILLPDDSLLTPPLLERCVAPVYITAQGQIVPNPYKTLNIAQGESDPAQIQVAWRQRLIDNPPEQDPDGARVAGEARARLSKTEHYLARELGVLHTPDADAWELPNGPQWLVNEHIDTISRFAGQSVLYALLEDYLS